MISFEVRIMLMRGDDHHMMLAEVHGQKLFC